ncbi:Putative protein C18orf25 [Chelonia mydas]|uniref:Uncharacterized protein n=1 Tax=Chelonia mydas TaxID=8469 RepID=M7CGT2_CHEMY|nr:Putative protein C18orf25 [Chelonia mydas]
MLRGSMSAAAPDGPPVVAHYDISDTNSDSEVVNVDNLLAAAVVQEHNNSVGNQDTGATWRTRGLLEELNTDTATEDKHFAPFFLGYLCRCHSTASMEPAQLTTAVASIVNTSRIILQYVQNLAERCQHKDNCDEDMDTDVPQSTGCGSWDIMAAVGLVDTVEC